MLSICSSTSLVDTPTEHAGTSEVAAVARISSTHHVLSVELLLGQLRHGKVKLGIVGANKWGLYEQSKDY